MKESTGRPQGRRPIASEAELEAFSFAFSGEDYETPEDQPSIAYKPYRPQMNPIQAYAFGEIQKHLFNLLYGERYSAKTTAGLFALVDHCRENFNARALLIIPTGRQGTEGGAWHKLNTWVRHDYEKNGAAVFTDPKENKYKDLYIWISNRFGGWSRVVMLSMPFEGFVADRVKGMEPTFVLVDEAQGLTSDTYFKHLVQQLGRDPHVPHQPVVYTCNPAGPSHWLYNRFFIMPVDQETGKWNDNYYVQHVPISDNKHNLPKYYWERLIDATKNDEVEYRRMILGEWVDAASGEAIFRNDYNETVHVRGDAIKNVGLIPIAGLPFILGFDLGSAHSAITYQQCIPTKDKLVWIIFDEVVMIDRYMPYRRLVPIVLERLDYWNQRIGQSAEVRAISGDDTFNQWRAKEGSFDNLDVQELSAGRLRLVSAPKGPHTIETRVRLTREKLQGGELLVSAICTKIREMFHKLEENPLNRLCPKPKTRFGHPWDAASYPWLYYAARGGKSLRPTEGEVKPLIYSVG